MINSKLKTPLSVENIIAFNDKESSIDAFLIRFLDPKSTMTKDEYVKTASDGLDSVNDAKRIVLKRITRGISYDIMQERKESKKIPEGFILYRHQISDVDNATHVMLDNGEMVSVLEAVIVRNLNWSKEDIDEKTSSFKILGEEKEIEPSFDQWVSKFV
jgi:hypothetical protein